jgi:UDP-N-acetylglucosamine--N-acetylmuramyl-(pentapeptide) pyrophosphoryl-undecaprenol N-acetylglucosamine transferase
LADAHWQVLHLSGAADKLKVEQAYAKVATRDNSRGFTFKVVAFTDRMAEAMSACDLIVSRAGASSLAEIQAVGKPSILMPYPFHKDRHQWHNAEVLSKARAAEIVDDLKDGVANAKALAPVLRDLVTNEERREVMGRAALQLDRPQSGQLIAEVLRVAGEAPAGSSFSFGLDSSGGLRQMRIADPTLGCVTA